LLQYTRTKVFHDCRKGRSCMFELASSKATQSNGILDILCQIRDQIKVYNM